MENMFDSLEEKVSRREFTVASALALLSGVMVTVVGCSSDDSPTSPSVPTPAPTPTGPTAPADVTGSVSANHGHTATITGAQLTSGESVSLDIKGSSNHPHTVELTAGELGQIGAGQTVSKASSTDSSHNHVVTFN